MQVATAIRGAIILAKMSVVPVRRGYWGNKIGSVHTVPTKVSKAPLLSFRTEPWERFVHCSLAGHSNTRLFFAVEQLRVADCTHTAHPLLRVKRKTAIVLARYPQHRASVSSHQPSSGHLCNLEILEKSTGDGFKQNS